MDVQHPAGEELTMVSKGREKYEGRLFMLDGYCERLLRPSPQDQKGKENLRRHLSKRSVDCDLV
jgi:hypothetical protein